MFAFHVFNDGSRRWWPKPYHNGPRLMLPITGLCILLWIFVIASCIYSALFEKAYGPTNRYTPDGYPPIRWTAGYDCDSSVIGVMFFPIALETIHVPIHIYLYITNRMHPIAAVVLSIILLANWAVLLFFGVLSDFCAEQRFPDAWEGLHYTRMALSGLLALLYVAYLGFASAALHRWRKTKRQDGYAGTVELRDRGEDVDRKGRPSKDTDVSAVA